MNQNNLGEACQVRSVSFKGLLRGRVAECFRINEASSVGHFRSR